MSEEKQQKTQVVEGEVVTTLATFHLPNGKSIPIEISTATLQDFKRVTSRVAKTVGGISQKLNLHKLPSLLKPPTVIEIEGGKQTKDER